MEFAGLSVLTGLIAAFTAIFVPGISLLEAAAIYLIVSVSTMLLLMACEMIPQSNRSDPR